MHEPTTQSRPPRAPAIGRLLLVATAAVALLAAGCGSNRREPLARSAAVRTDLSCDQLTEAARAQFAGALDLVTTSNAAGVGGVGLYRNGTATEAGPAPEAGQVVAGTNVAEQGVDEGDLVKTDGRRIVSMVDGTLRVVTLDGSPTLDGSLVLGSASGAPAQLFLRGDEALVLLSSWGGRVDTVGPDPTIAPVPPIPFDQGVTLVRVDLSDPAHPREVERRTVEGALVAARTVDGTTRVVVRSQPPVMEDFRVAPDAEAAQGVIDHVTAADLLPRVAGTDGTVGSLGTCGDVAVLPAIAGPAGTDPSTVSVLTVGDTLADLAPATVQGMADVVYASPLALYVTSTGWDGTGSSTLVHRFDITGRGAATYTGSGTAPGTLLDQYSLSERNGDLRLVTTVDHAGATDTPVTDSDGNPMDWTPVPASAGRLTVLRPSDGGGLAEVGRLDDLGVGERVQSVRFLDDSAYVVTFRQTDPLFALDLSDPTSPKALGELKTTGFSQYLHPVGDGLLLGLGRDATDSGSDTGLKVSLYDVHDPAAPVELDKLVIPGAWSSAADDPHAFTWDPVNHHAIFPLEGQGVMVVGVDTTALRRVAALRHETGGAGSGQVLRSVVVDRDLWTLSPIGLGRSDAEAPTSVDLIRFG